MGTIRQRWRRRLLLHGQAGRRKRIVLAFQPHRYTRTRDLLDDFASGFERRRCPGAARSLCRRRGSDCRVPMGAPLRARSGVAAAWSRSLSNPRPNFCPLLEGLLADGDLSADHGCRRYRCGGGATSRAIAPWRLTEGGAMKALILQRTQTLHSGAAMMAAPAHSCLCPAKFREHEAMSRHTSWRVGRPCGVFISALQISR